MPDKCERVKNTLERKKIGPEDRSQIYGNFLARQVWKKTRKKIELAMQTKWKTRARHTCDRALCAGEPSETSC